MLLKATAPNKLLTPAERNAKAKKELIGSEQALAKKDAAERRRLMAVYRLSETRPKAALELDSGHAPELESRLG